MNQNKLTWSQAIEKAIIELGYIATLDEIYSVAIKYKETTGLTPDATIREIVQREEKFVKLERGLYALKNHLDKLPDYYKRSFRKNVEANNKNINNNDFINKQNKQEVIMDNISNFSDFKKQWLEDKVLYDNPSTVEKGRRFAENIISDWLDFNPNDVADDDIFYCDGAGDGGIDIAYLERGDNAENETEQEIGNSWYLVQSKYGTAFQGKKTIIEEARKVFDSIEGKNLIASKAKPLYEKINIFLEADSKNDKLHLIFATNEPLDDEEKEQSKLLKQRHAKDLNLSTNIFL